MNLHLRRDIQRDFARLSTVYTHLAARRAHREMRELVWWVEPRADEWVLDAACGPGTLVRALAPLVERVWGVDLCPRMIQSAREVTCHSPRPPFFSVGDVERLPFRNGTFHLTTCTYSFANFPHPLRVVKELARVTRHRGRLVIADVVAPEDPTRCSYFNRLEASRGSAYARVSKYSDFMELFTRADLRLKAWKLPIRARRLRQMLLDSIEGDKAGLHPRRIPGDIVFCHTTAWFLLVRP